MSLFKISLGDKMNLIYASADEVFKNKFDFGYRRLEKHH